MSNNVYIPHDLVVEILSRLPVKSLMRFKCVSKSWHWMISHPDPDLSKRHMKQSKCNMKLITEAHSCYNYFYLEKKLIYDVDVKLLGEISNVKEIKYHPSKIDKSHYYGVIGCSNGVVCIRLDLKAFVLWNPSTRKHHLLPSCCEQICLPLDMHSLDGFGYDESTDDYKVARLVKYNDGAGFYRMHIFSLKSNKWRIMEDFACESDVNHLNTLNQGIFANGALHWLFEDHFTLAFNLGTEKFQVLPPPPQSTLIDGAFLCEGILNGVHHLMLSENCTHEKWIMKDNSWSLLTLKNFSSAGSQLLFIKPLFMNNNVEIYNLEKLSFEKIEFPNTVEGIYHHSYLYFESLFPLHNQEEQLGKGQKRKHSSIEDFDQKKKKCIEDKKWSRLVVFMVFHLSFVLLGKTIYHLF